MNSLGGVGSGRRVLILGTGTGPTDKSSVTGTQLIETVLKSSVGDVTSLT